MNLKPIKIAQIMTPLQQARIRKTFCKFTLNFSGATDAAPHAFTRCYCKLSFLYLLDIVGYKPSLVPTSGFDVILKDVGANPITHLKANRQNVHSCCPLMDNNDAIRRSNYLNELQHLRPIKTNAHRQLYQKHLNADRNVICNNLAQQCDIKATYVMFLHSIYDIEIEDVCMIMMRSNASIGVGCIIWDPIVMFQDNGFIAEQEVYFRKF